MNTIFSYLPENLIKQIDYILMVKNIQAQRP